MSVAPRQPAVAGTFYPAQPDRLELLAASLLAAAAAAPWPQNLRPESVVGLLVPHAGLSYSGPIAALGWYLAGQTDPSTIVLLGTDHQARAEGVGVWTGGAWLTPLGRVEIDTALAEEMAGLGPTFAADNGAHRGEHSLEVQLPLLMRACPAARIVPLAVSPGLSNHMQSGQLIGRALSRRRAAGERILLAASSDMAHYPPEKVCRETDAELLEPLLRLDAEELRLREARVLRANRPGLVCGLCGIDPVRVMLAAVAEMGASRGILLGVSTSADAGGDPRRTVGYASAAFV